MRTIKFRAKDFQNKWVYGDLHHKRFTAFATHMIEDSNGLGSDINPETLGQFTGRLDKNGVEIYEGDIINFTRWIGNWQSCDGTHKQLTTKHTIVWDNGVSRFGLTESSSDTMKFREHPQYIYEVVGNIFDTGCALS